MILNREVISVFIALALVFNLAAPAAFAQQDRVVPRDTVIRVLLQDDLSTKDTEVGEDFEAVVAEDVRVDNRVLIRQGDVIEGTVTEVEDAKRLAGLSGQARLQLRFDRVRTNGRSYPIRATIVSVHDPVKGLDPDDIER